MSSGGTGLDSERCYYQWDLNTSKYDDYLPNPRVREHWGNRGKGEVGPLIELQDITGYYHQAVKFEKGISKGEVTEGKSYYKPRQCTKCNTSMSKVIFKQCGLVLCYPLRDQ